MEEYPVNTVNNTHLKSIGYVLWIFGFTGSHRFYYGRPVSGNGLRETKRTYPVLWAGYVRAGPGIISTALRIFGRKHAPNDHSAPPLRVDMEFSRFSDVSALMERGIQ